MEPEAGCSGTEGEMGARMLLMPSFRCASRLEALCKTLNNTVGAYGSESDREKFAPGRLLVVGRYFANVSGAVAGWAA